MAATRSLRQYICSFILLVCTAQSLKFELHATPRHVKQERCIRNSLAKDTPGVMTASVGGYKGDDMTVDMHVCEPDAVDELVLVPFLFFPINCFLYISRQL